MTQFDSEIEKAAKKSSLDYGYSYGRQEVARQEFTAGALSPEAKEYWQQGIYTPEEVQQLLIKFKSFLWEREDFSTVMATKWFSQNKKSK